MKELWIVWVGRGDYGDGWKQEIGYFETKEEAEDILTKIREFQKNPPPMPVDPSAILRRYCNDAGITVTCLGADSMRADGWPV